MGKPGTLHTQGLSSSPPWTSAGPKRCFMHLEAGRGPRQGGDVGCIPADPEGRVGPSYRAGGGHSPKIDGGPPRNPFAFPRFPLFFFVPNAEYYGTLGRSVVARGEVPPDSFGACTPPHRQPLCGVVGPSDSWAERGPKFHSR